MPLLSVSFLVKVIVLIQPPFEYYYSLLVSAVSEL